MAVNCYRSPTVVIECKSKSKIAIKWLFITPTHMSRDSDHVTHQLKTGVKRKIRC